MNRSRLMAIALLGVTLAASVAARPGIYEYFKAGTKRGRPKSELPGHSRGRTDPSARTPRARTAAPWTEPWFADSTLVRRHLAAMTEALTVPMIGETYPLPRGGGFVCSLTGADATAARELICVLRCAGPELGGHRQNWFYASASKPAPTLDRVRWSILAPGDSPAAPWRAFYFVLAESLSRELGQPVWSGPDSTGASWNGLAGTTTMRLHGDSAQVDSLEVECVSNRLGEVVAGGRP